MKLYLISQNLVDGYDTYDSAVVAAKSEEDARNIHPSTYCTHVTNGKWMGTYKKDGKSTGSEYRYDTYDWVPYSHIDKVTVEYLGITNKERVVILSSFNAG